jgi:hypothetical protein
MHFGEEQTLGMSPAADWHDAVQIGSVILVNINVVYNMCISVLSVPVFEWLGIILLIWELPGSNLGPENICTELFRGFSQFLQTNVGVVR